MPLHKHTEKLQQIFNDVNHLYARFYGLICEIDPAIRALKNGITEPDLVDLGILARDIKDVFDEARKEAKRYEELCGKMLAAIYYQRFLNQDGSVQSTSVKGNLGSATPECQFFARKVPDPGTPEFKKFLSFVGITEEMQEKWFKEPDEVTGVINPLKVRIDWNGLSQFLSRRAANGEPMPPGIGEQFSLYSAIFRRSKAKSKTKDK